MKSLLLLAVVAAAPATGAAPDHSVRPAAGHPLIGKWQWTRSLNNCSEVYVYKADGTALVPSGTEKTDNVYTVTAHPDAIGFSRMAIRTTMDHGGKDCGDDDSDSTGMESTNFFIFNADRSQYLACDEPNMEKCFGPLRRAPE